MKPSTLGLSEGFWAGATLLALGGGFVWAARRWGVVPVLVGGFLLTAPIRARNNALYGRR